MEFTTPRKLNYLVVIPRAGYLEYALSPDVYNGEGSEFATEVGSVPPVVNEWGGFDGLDATNYYGAVGIVGASTFHVQGWLVIESQAVAAETRTVYSNLGTRGWRIATTGTNAGINWGVYDGAGLKTTAAFTVTAGMIGSPIHVCGVLAGGNATLKVNGVTVASVAIASYTANLTPSMMVGRRAVDTSFTAGGLVRAVGGFAGGHYGPSDPEVVAAYNAGLAAKDIAHIAGGTNQQAWSFKSLGSAPSTISPTVGAESLTKNGSPTWVSFP